MADWLLGPYIVPDIVRDGRNLKDSTLAALLSEQEGNHQSYLKEYHDKLANIQRAQDKGKPGSVIAELQAEFDVWHERVGPVEKSEEEYAVFHLGRKLAGIELKHFRRVGEVEHIQPRKQSADIGKVQKQVEPS